MSDSSRDEEALLRWLRDGSPRSRYRRGPLGNSRRKGRRYVMPQLGDVAQFLLQGRPEAGPDWARTCAGDWAGQMFSLADIREWVGAGLECDDVGLASDLRNLGISPDMLAIRVRGESMIERIRNRNYTASEIARTLRNALETG